VTTRRPGRIAAQICRGLPGQFGEDGRGRSGAWL